MKINKMLLGIVAAGAVLTLTACGSSDGKKDSASSVDKIQKKGTLTIALSPDYPPFEFQTVIDGKNKVVGSDIDLANAIAKELGVKVKISTMDFNNVLASVSGGKADLAISGISATPEREKAYDFSTTYYDATHLLVVKKSNANKYTSLADFDGKKVSAQKGSIQEGIVSSSLKNSTKIALPTVSDEINELKTGAVEGAVIEDMIAKSYVAANPDLAIAEIKVPKPKDDYGTAIAMPKSSGDLKTKVDAVIKKLKADGKITQSIEDNYKLSQEVSK